MPVVNPKDIELSATEQLARSVVLFFGMSLAMLLRDQHQGLRIPAGTREAHTKAMFSSVTALIYAIAGSSRSSIMSEIRKVLRVGPDKYYKAAISELRAFGKG